MTAPNETRLVTYLVANVNRIPRCFVWRTNTGAARAGERVIRFGTVGQADIIGCHNGHFIAIEVKTETGKQTKEQMKFEDNVRQAGGEYFLVRGSKEATALVASLENGWRILP